MLNVGPDWEWVINAEPLLLYPREGTTVVGEAGWDRDPWTYVEKVKYLAPTVVRTTNRPSRSESRNRLHHCGCRTVEVTL